MEENKTKAKIIAVAGKGGVGKTSLCSAIVRELVEAFPGKRILAIDADPAVGLSTALGVHVEHTIDDIRNEVIQIANIFRASIIDVSLKSLTLALIGDETKADAMQKLLESFGILELVRTGMVALERGAYTISDENKEKAEFNLGKATL